MFFNRNLLITSKLELNRLDLAYRQASVNFTLNNIIANLLLGYLTNRAVAISRRSNAYSIIPRIYKPSYYSYRKTISCIDWLIAEGFAMQSLGFYNRTAEGTRSKGRVTRIELTNKLLNEIQLPETEIKINHQQTTPIILKDKNNNLISYPYSDQTKEILKFLNEYNEFMEINAACLEVKNRGDFSSLFAFNYSYSNLSFNISPNPINSPHPPILITIENLAYKLTFETKCYRVFNNRDFTQGGRFYSGYQNLKKELRKELKLNGYSTVEIDYNYLHPKMLYNLEKLDYQNDPYIEIEGFERKEVKVLMQILLNAKNKSQALRAGIKHLNRKTEDIKRAFILLEDSHKLISKYFYSAEGIHLQRKDSDLAGFIMRHFMERNIPILGIHDSFIVPEHHQTELADTMNYYYQREFNYQPGLSIN